MSNVLKYITDLAPQEKRKLLAQLLRKKTSEPRSFPLSFAQQRLWFLDQLLPGTALYTMPQAVRLHGPLNLSALARSLNEVVRRHDALRTTFVSLHGQPAQLIAPHLTLPLPLLDLADLPPFVRSAAAARLASHEARLPFDLSRGPLLRASLLRLDPQQHILLLTLHHIISDGWSIGVLMRELAALYQAFSVGQPSPLPPLLIQYADFAHWQRGWLQGALLEEQLAYWKQQLGGRLPLLNLPSDRARAAVQSHRGARLSCSLPAPLSAGLRRLSRGEGVTLFMLLLAAFKVLLYRYSGQSDLLVGTPIANRTRSELEQLIGFFVNTLVLRTDMAGNPRFRELVGRVREVTMQAYAHQDLPFEKLVEELQPDRALSHAPLFQVAFALQNALPVLELHGLTLSPLERDNGTAKFDLFLSITEATHELTGVLEYNTDLFDRGTITRLWGHLQTLLEGIVADPEQHIADLPLLMEAERRQLEGWNETTASYPQEQCIHELFESQVARTPGAVALVFVGGLGTRDWGLGTGDWELADSQDPSPLHPFTAQHMTYDTLNRRANQVAHRLRALGVGPETLVGICMERAPELLIGLLGILKAGGAYVPLDPAYPPERLAFMLEDAQVPVLLTQKSIYDLRFTIYDLEESRSAIVNRKSKIVNLYADWPVIAAEPPDDPACPIRPDNLAYVIYTSGSTGVPKGVLGRHQGSINRFHWMWHTYPFAQHEVCCQKTALSFVDSVWDIFGPLLQGIPTIIIPDEVVKDPYRLVQALAVHRITRIVLVPSLLRLVLDTHADLQQHLPHLQYWITSGEALSLDLCQRFLKRMPHSILLNLYGSSEVSADVTWYEIWQGQALSCVPIGRPIANTEICVLDQHQQRVPIGVPGELYIGGAGLARGYLRRPDLTAERFIPNPFARVTGDGCWVTEDSAANTQHPTPNTRLYRTGDLARYLPDGTIEFLGRIDHQVKIRGFRIELGEIEAVLCQHPAVREATVLAREDGPGEKRLVAYVVPKIEDRGLKIEDSASEAAEPLSSIFYPLSSELRTFLQEHLPDYMLPAAFVTLEALPLTPNGKVDRQALPAPDPARAYREKVFIAPRTPVEEVLTEIWAEILRVKQVGIHDNFFELGGHSLLATQLIPRLREAFQIELPLRSLFENPTVAGLAAAITQRKGKQTEYQALPIIVPAPDQRHQPFPLTDIQHAYWIGRSGAFEIGNVATHIYLELESLDIDLERFNLAWQRLIDRHDMLRAIVLPGGQQQILSQVPPYSIEVLDLRGQDPQTTAAQLEALRYRMSHALLRTDQWPLFEICASRLEADCVRLCISIDLLNVDATSFMILTQELAQLYQNPQTPLAPLEISFRDYVLAEIALRDSDLYRRSQEYWFSRLPTLPPAPQLPLARNPHQLIHPRFVRLSAELEPETWRRLKRRATLAGLTSSAVLLAAFAEVLTVWSTSPRFTINVTLFNRLPLHPQVNGIVGDFTSMNLLAVDTAMQGTFEAQARRIQDQLWQDLDHRFISGVRVLRELARIHERTSGAIMPVVFTSTLALVAPDKDISALTSLGDVVHIITQTPQVWLDHQVSEQAGALIFNWDAVEELFPNGLLQDMFDAYCRLLQRLADDEESWREMGRQLVPKAQLEQRVAINATAAPVPIETLDTLFATQVAQRPLQPAVVSPNRTLTYEELYRRSHQVGRRLRQLGVCPNTLVAVVMEKGWEQAVAVLGVLQCGAAYVPIDPGLPKERLWYLLERSEARQILTQSWLDENLEWPRWVERICVDDEDLEGVDSSPLEPVNRPEDLAYVIYTSGSTGLPKGVMIEHRSVVNRIVDVNKRFSIGPQDRALALTALHHDLSVYDIFGILAAGGIIVMPNASRTRDPGHWAELLVREQITVWNSVPAFMEMLVEYLEHAGDRAEALSCSLRLVLLAGDWIPVTLPGRLKALSKSVQVISLGGPTETTIWDICHPIESTDLEGKSIPYGRPMTNAHYHVLNEALEPCPVWVPGQLFIGGAGLARGYWRDEGKAQASFIVHPPTGERLYRSGDRGRYLPNGDIEFLGREDFQVKIQGYRIELGEIEAALEQHPAVQAAAVTVVSGQRGNKRLVAYVVARPELVPAVDEPRNFSNRKAVEDYGQRELEGVLLKSIDRLEFKLRQPGLRQDESDRPYIELIKPEFSETLLRKYAERRSHRRFVQEPIPFEKFSEFLSCLLQLKLEELPLPKYRYPSAGSLYPVQTYLYIKPNRVEGLAPGIYYYHPVDHRLLLLSADARLERSIHAPNNLSIFDDSAFSLFLVGQLNAIIPLYGLLARDFCMLEAGYIGQLLMTAATDSVIGLCPVGSLDFERIRDLFGLEESHVLLHSLLGGREDTNQVIDRSLLWESSPASSSVSPFVYQSKPDGVAFDDLRRFLEEKLPRYMVPSAFVLLNALPLTSNGKLDRRALPEPGEDGYPKLEAVYVPPQTEMERILATLVQEVIHIEKVGINDNFFDLGIDSIQIVQVYNKLREVLKRDVSIVEIFRYPAISLLAEHLSREQSEQPSFEHSHDRAKTRKESIKRRRQSRQGERA